MGDPVQFQQVFMNLTLNGIGAIKHMEAGGELTIKSQTLSGQLLISVSNIGVGLPPKQADRIFNAFFATKLHGTSMGLSISRSIVESHGGRLWAADNAPRDTNFQLSLPTKDEAHE
jgi:signal transduction histidine kinase